MGRHVRYPPLRLAVALAVAALTAVPLVYVMVTAIEVGPAGVVELMWRPRPGSSSARRCPDGRCGQE
jgi:iron(III) transport system permease protein